MISNNPFYKKDTATNPFKMKGYLKNSIKNILLGANFLRKDIPNDILKKWHKDY